MTFAHAKLEIDQHGDCGFGLNVSAHGTYTRKTARRPRFAD
jgi:hypothetical protein